VDFQSVAAATVVGNSDYVLWSHASFASSYDCGVSYVGLPDGGFKKVALSFGVPSPMATCGVIWPTPRTIAATGGALWYSGPHEGNPEGGKMFTSIRKYNVRRGSAEELARRVQESFVPLMRQMQGFRGYYLLDGGPDVLITISMFDSADEAFVSNEISANWVRNNVLEFTKGLPEVMVGNALIAEVK
jgi:Antibiotic biosynthesis monooxygenase